MRSFGASPVLESLAGLPVSIDTAKAEVARRALELGAEMVNDVTALRADPGLAEVAAEADAYVCLMHMQGEPAPCRRTRPTTTSCRTSSASSRNECSSRSTPGSAGPDLHRSRHRVREDRRAQLRADPPARRDRRARPAGRRRVLAQELARQDPRRPRRTTGPLSASIAAAVTAYERGATILRVHDVKEHVEALTAAQAVVG